jgi:hypothetical protein
VGKQRGGGVADEGRSSVDVNLTSSSKRSFEVASLIEGLLQ